jgi:hypothetical protein
MCVRVCVYIYIYVCIKLILYLKKFCFILRRKEKREFKAASVFLRQRRNDI